MTLIKIDRSSVQRNPTAGATRFRIGGLVETTFEYRGERKYIEPFINEGLIIVDEYFTNGKMEKCSGFVENPNLVEKLIVIKGMSITSKRDIQEVNCFPQPYFLYKYVNTKLKCRCKGGCMSDDLESGELESGEYDELQCPKCKKDFEEILKWEDINVVAEELKLK